MSLAKGIFDFAKALMPDILTQLGAGREAEAFGVLDRLFKAHGLDMLTARAAIPDITSKVVADRAKRDAELAEKKAKAKAKKLSKDTEPNDGDNK